MQKTLSFLFAFFLVSLFPAQSHGTSPSLNFNETMPQIISLSHSIPDSNPQNLQALRVMLCTLLNTSFELFEATLDTTQEIVAINELMNLRSHYQNPSTMNRQMLSTIMDNYANLYNLVIAVQSKVEEILTSVQRIYDKESNGYYQGPRKHCTT